MLIAKKVLIAICFSCIIMIWSNNIAITLALIIFLNHTIKCTSKLIAELTLFLI